jgi:hypothetical protein
MSRDNVPGPGPEQPRVEPEIIPPGEDSRVRVGDSAWMHLNSGSGFQRVYIARPGLPSIILTVLILGLILAIIFLVLAGIVFLWIPILIGGIVLAMASGALRYRWRRFQAWLRGHS